MNGRTSHDGFRQQRSSYRRNNRNYYNQPRSYYQHSQHHQKALQSATPKVQEMKTETKKIPQEIINSDQWKDHIQRPNPDTRHQTEDVTATKGNEFEDYFLKRELLMGIFEMGYEKPSPIQEAAIPIVLAGRDIVARAKNGTGKTGSFLIPVLEKVDPSRNEIQQLVLVPTRELALQTAHVAKTLAKHMDVNIMLSTGGTDLKEDIMRFSSPCHVVVATPGRLLDLANKGVAKLGKCTTMVMDEADKLLSREFQPIIAQLIGFINKDHQILLFSATYPLTVKSFMDKYLQTPFEINLMDELTLRVYFPLGYLLTQYC